MKKHHLLKTILVTFLIFVCLSWFIDGGVIYNGEFYEANTSTALGLGDIFSLPFQAFYLFAEYGLIFIFIGGMYGIFNKTGAYKKIINKVASWFKNKEFLALVLTSIIFVCFEAIVGVSTLSFVLVPFFASILYEIGINKYKVMLATIGSIILATFGSVIGYATIINYLLGINSLSLVKVRALLLVISIIVLVISLYFKSRNRVKSKKDLEMLEEKSDILRPTEESKKSSIPLLIIMVLALFISILGMYNWKESLGIEAIGNFSANILDKISFLNGFSSLGSWGTKELAAVILIVTLITSIIYRIKFNDVIDAFKNGAKPMFKVAIYSTLCSLIFMVYYNSEQGYNFIDTIIYKIFGNSSDYLVLKTAIATPVSSFLLNNSIFLANSIANLVKTISENTSTLANAGLALQMTSSIASLVLPTSFILIAGLSYFDIPYLKWLKYIWKVVLVLVLITGIIVLI